jgi:TonB family protein
MQDRVADVLAQRAALDRGAGAGVALSVLLHGGLAALVIYTALHAPPPKPATMVNIHFAKLPAMTKAQAQPVAKAAPRSVPKLAEPKPIIAEPKPSATPPQKPEKNTVPLSPFGQSTKKGSERPAVDTPPPAAEGRPAPDIAVGASGITGLEGGDFPYTLYLEGMQRKIGGSWFRPTVAPGTAVIIYYRIQRDGKITDAAIHTPSGNGTFDRAALSAVRSASPLNPLPFAYAGSYLGVHLTFK